MQFGSARPAWRKSPLPEGKGWVSDFISLVKPFPDSNPLAGLLCRFPASNLESSPQHRELREGTVNIRKFNMKSTFLLPLGSIFVFSLLVEGRIVRDDEANFAECNKFFYEETPPEGLAEPFHVKICQKYNGKERFATLYSIREKIPVYSAFRYGVSGESREQGWMIEPQIDDPNSNFGEMMNEADAVNSVNNLGSKQALSTDYLDSDYQEGQLYLSSLNSDDFQVATYTLTNAAPMTQSFRERWYMNVKSLMDLALAPYCGNRDNLYVIAGAVPSDQRVKDKVSVPDFVWLAACCAAPGGWAMGFIKRMRDGDIIEDVMVKDLEKLLPSGTQLFQNNCGEAEQDTEKMKKILEMVNRVQDEERMVQAKSSSSQLSSTRNKRSAPSLPEEANESSLLRTISSIVATPFIKLIQLIYYLVVGILKNALYCLWYTTKQFMGILEDGVERMCLATVSYFMAIGEELVSIPWKVVQVIVKIIRALLRILCCLLKTICRVLSIPIRVLVDIVSFPMYTVCAIPTVLKDIAMGLGGIFYLLLDTAFGTIGSLFNVFFRVFKRIGFYNSGEL
ncbi:endonuclease domain-containing 1 protein [Dromiciops gliroides]|uniref:endonuclease domain-containing 1 protein n=1 Tax=Dromiciops gliroides TaxID=33562 RepID=UPI001CC54BEB|nr:endonuclease domain-containing 1 protein [Dromiciops gliroides]